MSRVLVIGCGGVASVAIQKCRSPALKWPVPVDISHTRIFRIVQQLPE